VLGGGLGCLQEGLVDDRQHLRRDAPPERGHGGVGERALPGERRQADEVLVVRVLGYRLHKGAVAQPHALLDDQRADRLPRGGGGMAVAEGLEAAGVHGLGRGPVDPPCQHAPLFGGGQPHAAGLVEVLEGELAGRVGCGLVHGCGRWCRFFGGGG